jgi:hypothetical protein
MDPIPFDGPNTSLPRGPSQLKRHARHDSDKMSRYESDCPWVPSVYRWRRLTGAAFRPTISEVFQQAKAAQKPAFITFTCCGFKTKADTVEILLGLQRGGADIIEVRLTRLSVGLLWRCSLLQLSTGRHPVLGSAGRWPDHPARPPDWRGPGHNAARRALDRERGAYQGPHDARRAHGLLQQLSPVRREQDLR